MESLLGLLRIHVHRGVNLAVRDVRSSDPYVVIKMGKQVKKDLSYFGVFLLLCMHFFVSGFLGFDGLLLGLIICFGSMLVLCEYRNLL